MEYADRLRKGEWLVKTISLYTAHDLIKKYHYAKSASKTATYLHGLFKVGDEFPESKCLGVAWWIPPTKAAAGATYHEGEWQKVLSLSRLVIHPDTPKNACSFLLMQSVNLIDNSMWECLVTYADTWQNHSGTIYKATNWEYMGLTAPSPVFQKDGKMMGKKRGGRTLNNAEMKFKGFTEIGKFSKHKFRMIIKNRKRHHAKKQVTQSALF